jgi:hypothetical protein
MEIYEQYVEYAISVDIVEQIHHRPKAGARKYIGSNEII